MEYNALYHYGVKGQRWGVRRFQDKDGNLTNAGKKRYFEPKQTHRQKLESKYTSEGMSEKQAKMAADRRIKTEKIIAATAGLTIAACAAYATNKYIKNYCDRTIKSGTLLQRIEGEQTSAKIFDTLYASKNKTDDIKYAGQLGNTRRQQFGKAFVMDLLAKDDIKVASPKNAEKIFKDLYDKDSDFRKVIDNIGSSNIHGENVVKDSLNSKNLTKIYDNFNSKLIDRDISSTANKFYDALKAKGYNAIQDVNDQKFSGYDAKNPLIIFGAKEKIGVKNFREMTVNEIRKNVKRDNYITGSKFLAKEFSKQVAPAVGLVGATSFGARISNTDRINAYRKDHPNTNKSDKEIIEILENE